MVVKFIFFIFAVCALAASSHDVLESRSFSPYNTVANIQSAGYQAEIHHVTTDDGYILEMHRIPYRRYQTFTSETNRPVVFLMHGLLSASNAFIVLGPEYSVGYNLADAGFDVWMGNARGNRNSRYHVSLDPDHIIQKREFFDFSFEEIGITDVATMIDYALDFTGMEKLHYIGHSQGGTVFLVLASMRPEYNDKLQSVHLLAGVGYMEYFPDVELTALAAYTDVIYNMATMMGMVELFPPTTNDISGNNQQTSDYCFGDMRYKYACDLIRIQQIARDDVLEEVIEGYEVGGAALKQIAHYGQNIRDKLFRRWNYNVRVNVEMYGTSDPPLYDLGLITANVTMHYTVNDDLLDERDVLAMANDMPNTIVRKVARETFLHEDFVAAYDAKELVTDYIIEAIRLVSTDNAESIIIEDTNQVGDTAVDEITNTASGLVLSNMLTVSLFIVLNTYVMIK